MDLSSQLFQLILDEGLALEGGPDEVVELVDGGLGGGFRVGGIGGVGVWVGVLGVGGGWG